MSFLDEYCIIFDSEEENKLEYTNIYTEYVHILDQMIDAKLKELAKANTKLLKEAKDMLIKWEARDPQTYLLWSTMNGWVYKGFERTYETMGVSFDKLYYESDTYALGKDVVQERIKKETPSNLERNFDRKRFDNGH